MLKKFVGSKRGKLAAAFVAVLVAAGAASAYWSNGGQGSGTETAGSTQAVTLYPGTPAQLLYPGTSTKVAVEITNPNDIPVNVPSLVLDINAGDSNSGFTTDQSGCDGTEFQYLTQDNGGDGWTVPANADHWVVPPSTITDDAVTLSVNAANNCQNANVHVFLQVGAS